jgi:hypothetical protein
MVDSKILCNEFCFDYRKTNIALPHVSNVRILHETNFNFSRHTSRNLSCTHRSRDRTRIGSRLRLGRIAKVHGTHCPKYES